MSTVWIVVLAVAAIAIQSVLFSLFNLKSLTYRRNFSRVRAYEGERVELIEILRNVKPLPVPWLRVESRISPFLRFGNKYEERDINADQYHKSIFFLGPFSQVTRRHEITCVKRGYYELGSVTLSAGDLFGMSLKSKQLDQNCALSVYPRLLSEDELDTPSSRWQGELNVRRWIMPDPFLTSGIRDYRTGDSVRDIHWRATARMGQLQVKVRDYTADPRMMVVLNVQTSENQWGELMEEEQAQIEEGMRIAATLCIRALNAGVDAGFACNGCLYGEKGQRRPVIVPSRRDAAQEELLLSTMARIVIHREITFQTFLEELGGLRGEDILIISAYESETIRQRIAALRAQGNSVTLYRLA